MAIQLLGIPTRKTNYSNWDSQSKIECEYLMITYMFEFLLNNHNWYINYHECKCYEVDFPDNANHDVFMRYSTRKECNEQGNSFVDIASSQRVVHVSNKKTVNWEIPLSPVF